MRFRPLASADRAHHMLLYGCADVPSAPDGWWWVLTSGCDYHPQAMCLCRPPPPITPNMTKATIDLTKPTSCTGPDGISYRHLKHLGPVAIRALTDIFNHSLVHDTKINIWKIGKIIIIFKPNKSPTEPASYRTISLLYNPSKYSRGWFSQKSHHTFPSHLHNMALELIIPPQHFSPHYHNTYTKA